MIIAITVFITLATAIYILYRIGKDVKKKEAELLSFMKKRQRENDNIKKMNGYSRKSTPKVPSNKK